VVARIGAAGEKPGGGGAAAAKPTPAAAGATAAAATPASPGAAPAAAPAMAPAASGNGGGVATIEDTRRRRSSPLVRRIAKEHGITSLAGIPGTGLSGRVTKRDILGWIESGQHRQAGAAAAPGGGVADGIDLTPYYPVPGPGDRLEPMNNVRKRTVAHMVASKRISAHVTSFFECDMSHIARLRARKKDEFAKANGGVNLSFTAFFLKAAVDSLKEWPALNCSVSADRGSIIHHPDINLGIAVALDWGLIVPVIHRAQLLNLAGLAVQMNDLATRARAKQLKPEEIAGGTFTITNPGIFGSLYGTPIIPQPQVAILGIGAIKKRPMVIEAGGQDTIAIRHMCNLSISFDHRVIDGAVADQFVSRVVELLEGFQESWI
jgi:pyruvate dehydrogenase E2 component (dihydrolipoamide acetyltransferase)